MVRRSDGPGRRFRQPPRDCHLRGQPRSASWRERERRRPPLTRRERLIGLAWGAVVLAALAWPCLRDLADFHRTDRTLDSVNECGPYFGYRRETSEVPSQCWEIVLRSDPEREAYAVSSALSALDAVQFSSQLENVRRAALCGDTVVVDAAVEAADRHYDLGGEAILADLVRSRFGETVDEEEIARGREGLRTTLDGLALIAWYRLTDSWPSYMRAAREERRAAEGGFK